MGRTKTTNYLNRYFSRKRTEDRLSRSERSKRMTLIKAKNTKFESDFILYLKKKTKKRFQKNVREIRGCPDIVFRTSKVCVFLDSDFWHGWQYPRWKHLLKDDFWRQKIEKNRKRDRLTTNFLRRNGWHVLRIWEHNIKKNDKNLYFEILQAIKSI